MYGSAVIICKTVSNGFVLSCTIYKLLMDGRRVSMIHVHPMTCLMVVKLWSTNFVLVKKSCQSQYWINIKHSDWTVLEYETSIQRLYDRHVYRNGQLSKIYLNIVYTCITFFVGSSPDRVKPDYKIGICCFSPRHAAFRRKSKDWLARNQDNLSEWGDMSIRGLLFQ